jgi:hypothetical protein
MYPVTCISLNCIDRDLFSESDTTTYGVIFQ